MFNPPPLSLLPYTDGVPELVDTLQGYPPSRAETSGHASIIASGPEDPVERLLGVSYDPRNTEALDILDLQRNLLIICFSPPMRATACALQEACAARLSDLIHHVFRLYHSIM